MWNTLAKILGNPTEERKDPLAQETEPCTDENAPPASGDADNDDAGSSSSSSPAPESNSEHDEENDSEEESEPESSDFDTSEDEDRPSRDPSPSSSKGVDPHPESSSAATAKKTVPEELLEAAVAQPAVETLDVGPLKAVEAVLYRIDGTRLEMVHPRAVVQVVPTEVQILESNGIVDSAYPISKICAVRQHRPTTCQFLVRGFGNKDAIEYGFHFPSSTDAAQFRVALQESLFDSLEVLSSFKVDMSVYDVHTKQWREWAEGQHFMIGRREEDGLGMVCVATPENDTLFLCELTREFQYWSTEESKVFTIWGPYLSLDGDSGDIHPTKYMLKFTIHHEAQEDSAEVLKLFEKLVGYEEKVVNVEQALAGFDATGGRDEVGGDDDDDVMWDDGQYDVDDEAEEDVRRQDSLRDLEEAEEAEPETDEYAPLTLPSPKVADDYEESPTVNKRRRNRTSISYDPSDTIIEKDPDAKLHRFMQCGEGRSFVCRANQAATSPVYVKSTSKATDFDLNVYAKNDRGLAEVTTITGDRFTYKKDTVVPVDGLLHSGESKLLMRADNDPNAVYYMDLERETVVSKFSSDQLPVDMIFNAYKGSNTTGESSFMAANNRAFFLMDTRSKKARGHTLEYATNPGFSAAGTDEAGHILLANRKGQLRLYDGQPNAKENFKIAKTQLDAIAEPIKAVDVTPDGSWICATMRTCLVVYPTRLRSTGQTGFTTRLGKDKPPAIYLRLKREDVMKYGLTDIDFQPAVFDPNLRGILTSTGNLAIVWDFKSIRRGVFDKYSIKITPAYIKDSRGLKDGSVVVAYPQGVDVIAQKMKSR